MQRPVFGRGKAAEGCLPSFELALRQPEPRGSRLDPKPRLLGKLLGTQQRDVLERRTLVVSSELVPIHALARGATCD